MWSMQNSMNYLIADHDAAVRRQQAEQQAAQAAAAARAKEAAEKAKAEQEEKLRIAEETICKELANKGYEACERSGSAEDIRAIDNVFIKGGNAVEFFKALQPFKFSCSQESVSVAILNSLINHGLYEAGWEEYVVENSGDAYELLERTSRSAKPKTNSPRPKP